MRGGFHVFFLALLGALSSCSHDRDAHNNAVFPGVSFALTGADRIELERKVMAGDVAAAHRLADYFFLFDGNEREGINWLQKAGDIGDVEAREIVLRFLRKGGVEDKARALELEGRWGASSLPGIK